MRKFLYMLAALLVLIGINTHDVEARTDVYATTYNGNSWYVDQRFCEESRGCTQFYSVYYIWP